MLFYDLIEGSYEVPYKFKACNERTGAVVKLLKARALKAARSLLLRAVTGKETGGLLVGEVTLLLC